jgi:hypothetical protein
MQKGKLIGLLKQHGDMFLTPTSGTTSLCTIEFKNKYIKSQTKGKKPWPRNKSHIVVFNWTDNRYSILDPQEIKQAEPLANLLKNFSNPFYKEPDK